MKKKILIVASNYYKAITQNLIKGALDELKIKKKKFLLLKYPARLKFL